MHDLRIKRVSRRRESEDPLRDIEILQHTVDQLRGGALVPRRVYRFDTHEEAHEWMMRQMASTHERRGVRFRPIEANLDPDLVPDRPDPEPPRRCKA